MNNLFTCNKPYQYVGGEFLSYNKDFESAKVRFAFAFPDKYEIGISNLGLRVLYEQVNKQKDYMADRAYALEPDFVVDSLYCVESKKPLKEFDVIGFSLQYEMAYPTVLKMLEMAQIPYKSVDRGEDCPIILAGGPCTYNFLPVKDFFDGFMIGDGEDLTVEICDIIAKKLPKEETLQELAKLEGFYSPKYSKTVNKRIAQLTYDTALKAYPIPYSSSVHDRAIIEIRRGCGRMCRFCQPGHVTLPVRERPAQDIIKIAKELVKNTGYDEYSLLSLSSNDYSNIKEVIKELSVDFDKKKVSVSLPSQRIDGFNLELAELCQSVRKSTMTLAPEAGSQRLRNVIKKNISREQIIDTALTLYENGWSKIKFYFIAGLPTETLEDMDEMAELLNTIKYRIKLLKKEKELKHGFEMTCTLSIFVPKPFTPFQFCPQMNLDEVTEHIHYLKDKTKHIKGLKINYHEKFVSQIEAVLTRGDESLCDYIEALYKKGCYLDAWGEYFDKNIWQETAIECGVNLEELAQRAYSYEENLPWEIINVGINKDWFISEHKAAMDEAMPKDFCLQPTCETKCVSCGVCPNLKTKKLMAPPYSSDLAKSYKIPERTNPTASTLVPLPSWKYRIKLTKTGALRYFSHLDWQNTFLKALARTDLKIAYSLGFNPTMKVSMGIALPLFMESDCELVDIEICEDLSIDNLKLKLEKVVPTGCSILEITKIDKKSNSIDTTACWAEYKIKFFDGALHKFEDLMYNTDKVFSGEEVLLTRKNKKGLLKTTNIKSSIYSYRFENDCLYVILKTGQNLDEVVAVRADDLMNLVFGEEVVLDIKRIKFFDKDFNIL